MLRDYSIRGLILGVIATGLYVTGYSWAAAAWGLFSVIYLGLATVWETQDRSKKNPERPDRATPRTHSAPTPPPTERRPDQAPQLPPHAHKPPDEDDDHGPRPAQ